MFTSLINTSRNTLYRVLTGCYRFAWRAKLAAAFLFGLKLKGAQVIILSNQRVVMIRNSYREGLYLPGGGMEGRETGLETAIRELREEVGLQVSFTDMEKLGVFKYRIDGACIADEIFLSNTQDLSGLAVDGLEVTQAVLLSCGDLDQHKREIQPHVFSILKNRLCPAA